MPSRGAKLILDYFLHIREDILILIERKDYHQLVTTVCGLMQKCIEHQEIPFFLALIFLLGKYGVDISYVDAGAFFLNQGLMVCDMTKSFQRKADFLIYMALAA